VCCERREHRVLCKERARKEFVGQRNRNENLRLFWTYVEMVRGELEVAGGEMWWDGGFSLGCGNAVKLR
jgi:hypothetical protein